ncbi:MAG TPA: lipase maturation factor family protein [Bryobacteraceae bacterium]|nr:lipase maturation factor family protein [Bryobacteraceae bacterium]
MSGKPLVIFDGKCGFCRIWIQYWNQLTGDRIDYAPSQEVGERFPQISPKNFGQSVQLAMPSGEVISGARGVFTTLTYAPGMAWLLWLYNHLPGFAPVTEAAYRVIAAHRTLFYHVTRFTFGRDIAPLTYAHVEWIFLRILALIYLVAFSSFGMQITGLIGSRGILPAGRFLEAVSAAYGAQGYWMLPGVFWLAHGDVFLRGVCIAGAAISVVLFFGYLERAALVLLYILYLSLCTAGQDFMSFQWDMLLLEAGFLAIFLGSSKVVMLLFRWLLFRLTFLSGAVKLLSHDTSWSSLRAVSFHYMTQPLPTPLAWYMNQLPLGFQRFSTGVVFFIELAVPFLIFTPRRWRFFGAACLLFLQVVILLTGNYTFFNLLTMALCLFLFDDKALSGLRLRSRAVRIRRGLVVTVAAVILILSCLELCGVFFARDSSLLRFAAPFGIVNTYGLFAVMTTTRPEIIVQGSNDGVAWLDYEFKYKPGDLRQAPRWVAPHQPRLDWQMWFAALSPARSPAWFDNFMVRLLQGSPDVTALLAKNPFPGAGPKYVRALLFDYSFTDFATHRATGAWWQRKALGVYFPAISLEDVHLKE